MRRYWLEDSPISHTSLGIGALVPIDGELFKHIFVVCRQSEGDRFELLASELPAYLVQVTEVTKKSALVRVIGEREVPRMPKPYIRILLSLPKYATLEAVIEKSVELGVREIVPFTSDFSFLRKGEHIDESRFLRWNKIMTGALQQSGRVEPLVIQRAITITDTLAILRNPRQINLFFYENSDGTNLSGFLRDQPIKADGLEWVNLIVGSEGGFSQKEVQLFESYGARPLSLGDQVLRVETACVAVTSILKYQLGWM